MNQEFVQLLAAAEAGELTAAARERLDELLREDKVLLEAVVDQLEVDALLRWQHGIAVRPASAPAPANVRRFPRRFPGRGPALLLSAAALLLTTAAWLAGFFDRPELDRDWLVEPIGDAAFRVVAAHEIHLDRGELRVRSTGATPALPLRIETPGASAEAKGTSFLIGTHRVKDPEDRDPKTRDMNFLTRILVLSGTVTLTTALGAAEGQADELLVAPQGQKPGKLVLRTGGEFGFDLYRQLAKENAGQDLFFSAYSIASALSMAAEGARGDTAEEMGRVLRWPEAARRVGDDAQTIPFEAARIHGAFAELNRLFNTASRDQEQIAARLAQLKQQMDAIQARSEAASAAGDRVRVRELRQEMRPLSSEYVALAPRLKTYKLRVANAVWGDTSYPFDPDYLRTITGAYDSGAVVAADFRQRPREEIGRINAWVEKQTEGRIKDIASYPAINELTRLVLLNAIYFKAEWQVPFTAELTRDLDFTGLDGSTAKVKMMAARNREDCRYGAFLPDGSPFASPQMIDAGQKDGLYPGRGGFQVVEIPYRGGDLSMVVLLPQEADGLHDLEQKLSAESIHRWSSQLAQRQINLRLPRWKVETTYGLNPFLQAMGMKKAFDRGQADFRGMIEPGVQTAGLYIQAVMHKAFVEVNEAGTEAAAATMVAVGAKGMPSRVPFVPMFDANRPFVYLIRDLRTGVVLFAGRKVK